MMVTPFVTCAEKLKVLQQLCQRLGVHTEPACVGGVWIVPLLSW